MRGGGKWKEDHQHQFKHPDTQAHGMSRDCMSFLPTAIQLPIFSPDYLCCHGQYTCSLFLCLATYIYTISFSLVCLVLYNNWNLQHNTKMPDKVDDLSCQMIIVLLLLLPPLSLFCEKNILVPLSFTDTQSDKSFPRRACSIQTRRNCLFMVIKIPA